MAGSMRQRGENSWLLSAYLGWDPAAKKRRYVTKTVHGCKRQAEKALADLVSQTHKESHASAMLDAKTMTIGRVLSSWLDARLKVLSPATGSAPRSWRSSKRTRPADRVPRAC